MEAVRIVLNLLWLIFVGIWMALGYALAGLIMCILIVTIPWGIAAFRIALYTLWPFGSHIERRPTAGVGSTLGNVIWFVFAGWWLAIGHVLTAIPLALTIIGIPFAWANLKLIPVSLTPLGRRIVDSDDPRSFGIASSPTYPPGAAHGATTVAPAARGDVPWYGR